MISCFYCGETIDPDHEKCWRGVSGWEEFNRSDGGTHAIVGRKPKDIYACIECIAKVKRGITPTQERLSFDP